MVHGIFRYTAADRVKETNYLKMRSLLRYAAFSANKVAGRICFLQKQNRPNVTVYLKIFFIFLPIIPLPSLSAAAEAGE